MLGDLRTVEDENEAAYAFLHRHDAELWLAPFHSGSPTSLHFASASGVPPIPEEGVFPHRNFRPTRVLRPLLSARATPESAAQPLLWAREHGRGRVVYDALGHSADSIRHPVHRRILQQSARWLCGDCEKAPA